MTRPRPTPVTGGLLGQVAEAWSGLLGLAEPLQPDQVRVMLRALVEIAPARRGVTDWSDTRAKHLIRRKAEGATYELIGREIGVTEKAARVFMSRLRKQHRHDRLVTEVAEEHKAEVRARLVAALRTRAAALHVEELVTGFEPRPASRPAVPARRKPWQRTWTPERVERLHELKAEERSERQIAEDLGVTETAVNRKWHALRQTDGTDAPRQRRSRAGQEAKPSRPAKGGHMRDCLKCRKRFRSEGIHNRVCGPCKNTADWVGADPQFTGVSL